MADFWECPDCGQSYEGNEGNVVDVLKASHQCPPPQVPATRTRWGVQTDASQLAGARDVLMLYGYPALSEEVDRVCCALMTEYELRLKGKKRIP